MLLFSILNGGAHDDSIPIDLRKETLQLAIEVALLCSRVLIYLIFNSYLPLLGNRSINYNFIAYSIAGATLIRRIYMHTRMIILLYSLLLFKSRGESLIQRKPIYHHVCFLKPFPALFFHLDCFPSCLKKTRGFSEDRY